MGAIIGGFGWRVISEKGAMAVTTGLLFLSCLLSWAVFLGHDGQTTTIIPSEGLVVVRLGLTPSKLGYKPQAMVQALVAALK